MNALITEEIWHRQRHIKEDILNSITVYEQ